MLRYIILNSLLVILLLNTKIAFSSVDQHIIADIQKIVDQDRLAYDMTGLQVSILFPGEINPYDFVSGTTTLNGSQLITKHHLFQIGSNTKSFTAAMILLLEAEGKLSINDPIEKYLPNLPTPLKNITIKQLLNHTSGIYDYLDSTDDEFYTTEALSNWKKMWTLTQLVNLTKNHSPYFLPGQGYTYSSTNYILAGMIIHAVTRQSIETLFNERLFKPLKLHNTFYIISGYHENFINRLAHGYSKGNIFPDEPYDITYLNLSWGQTAGAITTNTHDEAIWLYQLMQGPLLPVKQQKELMSIVSTTTGQPISIEDNMPGYGLGLGHNIYRGEAIWAHDGQSIGYNSTMVYLPCRNIVITSIVNNRKSDAASEDSFILFDDIFSYLQKIDPKKECLLKKAI